MDIPWEWLSSPWWSIAQYAQLAFTVAMLIHAYRNGAEVFWYFLIFLLQPFGAWAYFAVVFIRSVRWGGVSTGPTWQRKLSLAELQYRADKTPTVNNKLALAEALMVKG